MKEHPDAQDIAILAEIIHRGQTTADGKPYILHPEAVASIAENLHMEEGALRAGLDSKKLQELLAQVDIIRQIGLLHDSFDQPKRASRKIFENKNIRSRVIYCVELLTPDPTLSYEENIFRVLDDDFAVLVKRADLAHNTRTQRLPARIKAGMSLENVLWENKKYVISYLFLSKAIPKEDYHHAMRKFS